MWQPQISVLHAVSPLSIAMSPALQISALLTAVAVTLVGASSWHYDQQEEWPLLCNSGHRQSPIELGNTTSQTVKYDKLALTNYQTVSSANFTNNGHTVQVDVPKPGTYVLSGAGLLGVYYLSQIHFHWGAEHTIRGKRYPLEMHLVHYGKQYARIAEALQEDQGVAVIGILFKESDQDNKDLQPLIDGLAKVDNKLNVPVKIDLAPQQLLPSDLSMFYRYLGSLTTPDCTETVVWTVVSALVPISKKQLASFEAVRVDGTRIGKNYRDIKPLNGRVISTPPSPHSAGTPIRVTPVASLALAVAILTLAL